ncbi:30S ribosome-binding factor RbfA [Bacteroidales bacterium OttesenSCG-928-C19]|nr:30S ribosome-binding factor RbfA [Bacteroidales bacterium OttesenSCG-928-C19]
MESTRQQKIARLIQKDLGEIFQQSSRELFNGAMITVTEVRVTKDLSIARVFVSIFPIGVSTKEQIRDTIKENKAELRKRLGIRVKAQLRVIPDLDFFLDDSLDYLENIEKLLKQ